MCVAVFPGRFTNHRPPDRDRRITYHPREGGWKAIIEHGIIASGRIVAATIDEAIAADYQLAKEYPEAERAPLHLDSRRDGPCGWSLLRRNTSLQASIQINPRTHVGLKIPEV